MKRDGDGSCRRHAKQLGKAFETAICEADPEQGNATFCMPAQCAVSTDCEVDQTCDNQANRCVAIGTARCPTHNDEECQRYEGHPICNDGLCAEPECTRSIECKQGDAEALCSAGRCVNPAWACVDQPAATGFEDGTVSYSLTVLDVVTNQIPADLEVTLCGSMGTDCTDPPSGARFDLDRDKARLTVRGVAAKAGVHLRLTASGAFPTEFYSQKVLTKQQNEIPAPVYLIPHLLIPALENATDSDIAPESHGTAVVRTYGCSEEPEAGVTVTTSRIANGALGTRIFYIAEGNSPQLEFTATDRYGSAGIGNMPPGKPTTITMNTGTRMVGSLEVIPMEGWLTEVHMYPATLP